MNKKIVKHIIRNINSESDYLSIKERLIEFCNKNPHELIWTAGQFVVYHKEGRERQRIISLFLFDFIFKENGTVEAFKLSCELYIHLKKKVDIFGRLSELLVSYWGSENISEVIQVNIDIKLYIDLFDCYLLNELILRGAVLNLEEKFKSQFLGDAKKFRKLGFKLYPFERDYSCKIFQKGEIKDVGYGCLPSCFKIDRQVWTYRKEDFCELFISLDFTTEKNLQTLERGVCLSGIFINKNKCPSKDLNTLLIFQIKNYFSKKTYQKRIERRLNRKVKYLSGRKRTGRRGRTGDISRAIWKMNLQDNMRNNYRNGKFLLKDEKRRLEEKKYKESQFYDCDRKFAIDKTPISIERVFQMVFSACVISGFSGAQSRLKTWEIISGLSRINLFELSPEKINHNLQKFTWYEHSSGNEPFSSDFGLLGIDENNNKFAFWSFGIY